MARDTAARKAAASRTADRGERQKMQGRSRRSFRTLEKGPNDPELSPYQGQPKETGPSDKVRSLRDFFLPRPAPAEQNRPYRNRPYPVVDPDELDGWYQESQFPKSEILDALQGRNPGLMAVLNDTYQSGGNTYKPLQISTIPRKDDFRYGVPEGGSGIRRPANPAADPFQGAVRNTGRVLKMPFEGLGMLRDRTIDAGADALRFLSGPPMWELVGDGQPAWRDDERLRNPAKESTTQTLWRDLIRELIHGPRKPDDED